MGDYQRSPTAVDPGPWLFTAMSLVCVLLMLVLVPLMVSWRRRRQRESANIGAEIKGAPLRLIDKPLPQDIYFSNIMSFDDETRAILRLALPYTLSTVSFEFFSNICLIMISQYIGTHQVAAYALVHILANLVNEVLLGPIYACTTLCAHAVGAGNPTLAGQYVMLAILVYLIMNIPVLVFWYNYMGSLILFLQWGVAGTAELAQDFISVHMYSFCLQGLFCAFKQLLDVTDRAIEASILRMTTEVSKMLLIWAILYQGNATLRDVAIISVATAFLGLMLIVGWSYHQGWITPFFSGGVTTIAFSNLKAIRILFLTAMPLSWESFLSNAEWSVLTLFASFIGTAEVAAWAILGNIWDLFYYISTGAGAAAEIRVSIHLGNNHPFLAKLSAYKSLGMGLFLATVVSVVFFVLRDVVPIWYTDDEALASILKELVPYVGVANLTMTFGMDAWSMVGAQGKYDLATWISFFSSWGVCMPLAFLMTFVCRFDLQGIAAAVAIGYVTTGAVLSFVLLSSDWDEVAQTISDKNAREEEIASKSNGTDETETLLGGTSHIDYTS